jgi:hypothetical protein
VSVKASTRAKLRQIFFIPHSSHADVVTDHMGIATVMSDGTTNVDLQSLTVEKMHDYLGSAAINETVHDLFKRCVQKIESPTPEPIIQPLSTTKAEIAPQIDLKADSKVVGETIKCEKCAFESKSAFAIRMHISKKHK